MADNTPGLCSQMEPAFYTQARKKMEMTGREWADRLGIAYGTHKHYSAGTKTIPAYIGNHVCTLLMLYGYEPSEVYAAGDC